MIKTVSLTKYYGDFRALNEVNIDVKKGEIYGLVGPNGAGKTTLIKHLAGVYHQDGGNVFIKGINVFEKPEVKERLAYIPDDVHFFAHFTIDEMRNFVKGIYDNWNNERYLRLLDDFEFTGNEKIKRLSKGMKKQVAFVLALAIEPEIMILDEPVDGLDPINRRKVWRYILDDVKQKGTTVLISSHNLRELEDVCTNVGFMNHGQVILQRDLNELKQDVHKIQVAFNGMIPHVALVDLDVIYKEKVGSVNTLIVRGSYENIIKRLSEFNPLFLDRLPLSLEEVFLYELGGDDEAIRNIIL